MQVFFCEMLKTCSHVTLVLKLSCFDLSVVHLALSGSVVGSSLHVLVHVCFTGVYLFPK